LPTCHGVYFVNFEDQQIYCVDQIGQTKKLTDEADTRFADLAFSATRDLIVAVAEVHASDLEEPQNELVAVDPHSGDVTTLHRGHDFYASAKLSPDGAKICWLTWDHPNMPWDGTDLWQAELTDATGSLNSIVHVAGGKTESVFQPEWSPTGALFYVSDRTNWWNIYAADGHRSVCPMAAEFGMPQWVFGMRRYAFLNANTIISAYTAHGIEGLATITVSSGEFSELARSHSSYDSVHADGDSFCYIAQSSTTFPSLYLGDIATPEAERLVLTSSTLCLDAADLSAGRPVSYPTANGDTAHGFLYLPCNANYEAAASEKPPLLVVIHGGPTSATHNDLSLKIQFWTSRGFAVFDSNYRGSTGYGRQYRDALKGQWGVVDVEDCDYAVRYLISQSLIDPARVAIRGGSSGGFTTLAALAATDSFKAGASFYGVTDLKAIAQDTHKFESRYLDTLIGPYPAQEALYEQRSPVNQVASISSPVIFLQGLDDKIVPPNQSEMMVNGLLTNGVKVAYIPFEGEGHGFRQSGSIVRAFGAELWFYAQVFGFEAPAVDGVGFIDAPLSQ
jgi:dipeptidyl aminopeptidase/acylaminoacyl peptidase